jgi:hypothetical protein
MKAGTIAIERLIDRSANPLNRKYGFSVGTLFSCPEVRKKKGKNPPHTRHDLAGVGVRR